MMVYKIYTVLVAGVFLWVQGSAISADLVVKDSSGINLPSGSSQLFGVQVTIECSVEIDAPIFAAIIQVEEEDSWKEIGRCFYTTAPDGTRAAKEPNPLDIKTEEVNCDKNLKYAKITTNTKLSLIENYKCVARNPTDGSEKSSDIFVLKIHTQPDTPKIVPDKIEVEEGKALTVNCTSQARPVPGLDLRLDGETRAKSTPAETLKPLLQSNTVSWDITSADRSWHGKDLECKVVGHSYTTPVAATIPFYVMYGPDSGKNPAAINYNARSKDKLKLDGTMDGYPELNYEWFHKGASTSISTSAVLDVPASDYESIAEFPVTLSYIVKATNERTTKSQTIIHTVIVDNKDVTTASLDSSHQTTDPPKGMPGWQIAIIVVAVIIVMVIVIGVTVLVRKRNSDRSSSAMKSKAAQARRSSDERNDSRYHTSTASLARQDQDRVASYHENPTLPMEYRYSQGNVEQYAEVIDDMPRSRKPIALEDMDMYDSTTSGPPMFEEAPPAYNDMNPYRVDPNYSTYSPNNYDGATYGAAC